MKYLVKSINTEEEYHQALEKLDILMNMQEGIAEEAYLEALCIEVERYENIHFPIPKPTLLQRIRFHLDQQPEILVYIAEDMTFAMAIAHIGIAIFCLVSVRTIIGTILSCTYLGFSIAATYFVSKLIKTRKGE